MIIAEIIERDLIVDFALMRKKESDIGFEVSNRSFKLLLLSFDRVCLPFFPRDSILLTACILRGVIVHEARDLILKIWKIKMDLHIVQLFARLQCLKLMYEYLTSSATVPIGFNYREKFDSDLTKHLDQIKVHT